MKTKILIGSLCGYLLVLGIVIGAIYHAPLLSIFDGVHALDEKDGTPAGFNITPDTAKFIHDDILRNLRRGGLAKSPIYVDAESYYVLGYGQIPDDVPVCSYHARVYGTRINGKDGTVYNSSLGSWEKVGYLNMTKKELRKLIKVGMKEDEVIAKIGRCSQSTYGGMMPMGEELAARVENCKQSAEEVYYSCTDGEIALLYVDDELLRIASQNFFIRCEFKEKVKCSLVYVVIRSWPRWRLLKAMILRNGVSGAC